MNISLVSWYWAKNWGDTELTKNIVEFFENLNCIVKLHKENDWEFEDVIVVGGGNIIQPSFWIFKDIERLIKLKKKIIFFNVGVTEEAKNILSKINKTQNCLWVVREKPSISYLKQNNINNILYAPDICFSSFKNNKLNNDDKILSVCLNHYIFHNIFSNDYGLRLAAERCYKEIADFILWMMKFKWKIRLVPLQTAQQVDDRITNGILHGLLNYKSEMIWDNKDVLNDIKNSSFILSSRYHLSIYALANQIPLVDILYHSKNTNLYHDVDFNEHTVNYYNLSKDVLINAAIQAENNNIFKLKVQKYSVMNDYTWSVVKQKIQQFLNT